MSDGVRQALGRVDGARPPLLPLHLLLSSVSCAAFGYMDGQPAELISLGPASPGGQVWWCGAGCMVLLLRDVLPVVPPCSPLDVVCCVACGVLFWGARPDVQLCQRHGQLDAAVPSGQRDCRWRGRCPHLPSPPFNTHTHFTRPNKCAAARGCTRPKFWTGLPFGNG